MRRSGARQTASRLLKQRWGRSRFQICGELSACSGALTRFYATQTCESACAPREGAAAIEHVG
eukprot:9181630-Pyramimonas_sp.AAC.1